MGLRPIGDVRRYSTAGSAVTIKCNDSSQVRISVLAPNPVRVTSAFRKGIEKSYFDFGHSTQEHIYFVAEGGEMNYYFFGGHE
jgi:hypothetical protein